MGQRGWRGLRVHGMAAGECVTAVWERVAPSGALCDVCMGRGGTE